MTLTYRSPVIDAWSRDLAANDDRPITAPYLADEEAIPVLRVMHAAPRLRRGVGKLTLAGALLYLAFAAFVVIGLGAILAGLCAVLDVLSAMGVGQ